MIDEKQETVADIVAFIGKCLDLIDTELTRMSNKEHALSADALLCSVLNAKAALVRIEAAWNRERAKVEADALEAGGIVEAERNAEKSSAVGNAAAMRDALLNIQEYAAAMDVDDGNVLAILDACRDALSAPARNCDIYTTSEDADRAITEYCSKMTKAGECLKSCPYRESDGGCAFGWFLATTGQENKQ